MAKRELATSMPISTAHTDNDASAAATSSIVASAAEAAADATGDYHWSGRCALSYPISTMDRRGRGSVVMATTSSLTGISAGRNRFELGSL